jgi:hypothetical protein
MDASSQVIFLFQVIINLSPIALYFLVLGLVNSQARPWLVDARSDFVILTLVFVPVLVWPIPELVEGRHWIVLSIGGGVGLWVFGRMLPTRSSGWVVYNISESRCRNLFDAALRRAGIDASCRGNEWNIPSGPVTIRLTALPVLRNVSLHVDGAGSDNETMLEDIRKQFDTLLGRQALLPSLSGSCMVLMGVVLMIFPLWMMSKHFNAIVELVSRLLFA